MRIKTSALISVLATVALCGVQGCKVNKKDGEVKTFSGKIGSTFVYLVDTPVEVKPSMDPNTSVDLGNTEQTVAAMFSSFGICYTLLEATAGIADFSSPENLALAVNWPIRNAYPVRLLDSKMPNGQVQQGLINALLADPRTNRLGKELISSTNGIVDTLKQAGYVVGAAAGVGAATGAVLTPWKRIKAESLGEMGKHLSGSPMSRQMRISPTLEKGLKRRHPGLFKEVGEVKRYLVAIEKVKPEGSGPFGKKIQVAMYYVEGVDGKIKALSSTADPKMIARTKKMIGVNPGEIFSSLKTKFNGMAAKVNARVGAATSLTEIGTEIKANGHTRFNKIKESVATRASKPVDTLKKVGGKTWSSVDNVCLKGTGMTKIACLGAAVFAGATITTGASNLLGTNRMSSQDLDNASQGLSNPELDAKLQGLVQSLGADHKATEAELIGLKDVIQKLASQNPFGDGPCLPPSSALDAQITAATAEDPTLENAADPQQIPAEELADAMTVDDTASPPNTSVEAVNSAPANSGAVPNSGF